MRHHLRLLALVAGIASTGSLAEARPSHHARAAKKAKHRAKVTPPDDAADEAPAADGDRVAFASQDAASDPDVVEDRDDTDEVPLKLHRHAARHGRDWHVAVGPYLWASSVDANVSIGSASIAAGTDFLQTTQHAKYGVELLADARYGRFSLSSDFMYGVVGLEGGTAVGPVMVTVNGTASSLMVDGFAGYQLAGDDHSALSIEARGGVRYQRTSVAASVDVAGSMTGPPELVDAGRDMLAGTRVVLRPSERFYVTGTADLGVFGSSTTTWSASADASLRLGSRVLLSVGWRTLTIDRAHVSMVMHGPRAALQLLF